MTQSEKLEYLIKYLLDERGIKQPLPTDDGERFRLFRALVNTRDPMDPSSNSESVYLLSAYSFK